MKKPFLKRLKHGSGDFAAEVILSIAVLIFRRLREKRVVSMARILGTVAFHFFRGYRRRVIANLSFAFGQEKRPDEIHRLARDVFYHLVLTPLETIYSAASAIRTHQLSPEISIDGKERLDEALSRGRGVIALGAHFGSFTMLGARLGAERCPVDLVINEGPFPKFWGKLAFYQSLLGQKTFTPRSAFSAISKSLNCLRRNEILYLMGDEAQRHGGIPVPFFGRPAFTPPGPAMFSVKTGAPILPMFVVRGNEFQRTLVIGSPIEIERTSEEKKDIETLTTRFTKAIEEIVRQYPGQWAWLNRRWKAPHTTRES